MSATKKQESPSPDVADAIRAMHRAPDTSGGGGHQFIPRAVARCKRCGSAQSPLRAVNPSRELVLIVCDDCSIGTEATGEVLQFIADQAVGIPIRSEDL